METCLQKSRVRPLLSQMESDFRREKERRLERQTTNKHKQSAIEKTKKVEEEKRLQQLKKREEEVNCTQQMVKSRKKQIETQVPHLPV